jgi:hypothetical protein
MQAYSVERLEACQPCGDAMVHASVGETDLCDLHDGRVLRHVAHSDATVKWLGKQNGPRSNLRVWANMRSVVFYAAKRSTEPDLRNAGRMRRCTHTYSWQRTIELANTRPRLIAVDLAQNELVPHYVLDSGGMHYVWSRPSEDVALLTDVPTPGHVFHYVSLRTRSRLCLCAALQPDITCGIRLRVRTRPHAALELRMLPQTCATS